MGSHCAGARCGRRLQTPAAVSNRCGLSIVSLCIEIVFIYRRFEYPAACSFVSEKRRKKRIKRDPSSIQVPISETALVCRTGDDTEIRSSSREAGEAAAVFEEHDTKRFCPAFEQPGAPSDR